MNDNVAALAAAIRAAKQDGHVIVPPSTWRPTSASDAYAVQRRAFGDAPIRAWKVAQSASHGPMLGPVPEERTLPSGAVVKVPAGLRCAIEMEIAFVTGAAIAAGTASERIAALLLPAALVEIVVFDLEGRDANDDLMKIASGMVNRAVVCDQPHGHLADDSIVPRLFQNDSADTLSAPVAADIEHCRSIAASAFAWLANEIGPVAAGTIVTTGSIGQPWTVERSCDLIAEFADLGRLLLSIEVANS